MEGGAPEERSVLSEVKKQLRLAVPLVVGCLLQRIILTISLMFVGHLGELALASASLATSFACASGFYLMTGMAWSLDTLCGQAFGAEQHRLVGVYKQRAMLVLALASIPVAVVWAFAGEILVWFRQDPEIAAGAGSYLRWLIPAVFLFGQLQCHVLYLQTQNIVVPVMLSSGVTVGVHVAVCWLLVHRLGLGVNGAALGIVVSYFFNMSCLALYVRLGPSCKKTWTGFSREAFRGIPAFLKLAVPSALMLCLESWAFELLTLLSGLLPNPKLETAVLSICFNTYILVFMVPLGLGFAARQVAAKTIRVSNELGAGRPQAACLATRVVVLLAFSMSFFVALVLVLLRNRLGYVYTNVEEVAMYSSKIMPIFAACFFFDSVQCVLSGVVRGCGRQNTGAFINLAAYYLVGIPAASIFAFVCHLRGKGLWFGIFCGVAVQTLLLLSITLCTNWSKEALKAKDMVFRSTSHIETKTSGTHLANGCSSIGIEAQETIEGTNSSVEHREGLVSSSQKTWAGFSREAFCGIPAFLKLAVPPLSWSGEEMMHTSIMSPYTNTCHRTTHAWLESSLIVATCSGCSLECWAFELLMLLSGLLPNQKLETAVLSICFRTYVLAFMVPMGLGFAVKLCVLSGVVRGCGRQNFGAFINLAAYYLVGIPAASICSFVCHLKGKGLWFGILRGVTVQMLLIVFITLCTSWNKQASKAKDRVFRSTSPADTKISGTQQANGCNSFGNEAQGTTEETNCSRVTEMLVI
ncbi:hypothetical protein EJB05_24200 [Eragrostis curvula]|uniref:Protein DETOXIFICATION n=1 Tax=Eragrostis curvula TaxID=38414 RepID=A0A5J9V8J8_9POAL|nr:hypothetical protein EJB05_24200 [Eragrostis curvula]